MPCHQWRKNPQVPNSALTSPLKPLGKGQQMDCLGNFKLRKDHGESSRLLAFCSTSHAVSCSQPTMGWMCPALLFGRPVFKSGASSSSTLIFVEMSDIASNSGRFNPVAEDVPDASSVISGSPLAIRLSFHLTTETTCLVFYAGTALRIPGVDSVVRDSPFVA